MWLIYAETSGVNWTAGIGLRQCRVKIPNGGFAGFGTLLHSAKPVAKRSRLGMGGLAQNRVLRGNFIFLFYDLEMMKLCFPETSKFLWRQSKEG